MKMKDLYSCAGKQQFLNELQEVMVPCIRSTRRDFSFAGSVNTVCLKVVSEDLSVFYNCFCCTTRCVTPCKQNFNYH